MPNDIFPVHWIVKARLQNPGGRKPKWEYTVRWYGYSESENTVEPEENLEQSSELLHRFWEHVGGHHLKKGKKLHSYAATKAWIQREERNFRLEDEVDESSSAIPTEQPEQPHEKRRSGRSRKRKTSMPSSDKSNRKSSTQRPSKESDLFNLEPTPPPMLPRSPSPPLSKINTAKRRRAAVAIDSDDDDNVPLSKLPKKSTTSSISQTREQSSESRNSRLVESPRPMSTSAEPPVQRTSGSLPSQSAPLFEASQITAPAASSSRSTTAVAEARKMLQKKKALSSMEQPANTDGPNEAPPIAPMMKVPQATAGPSAHAKKTTGASSFFDQVKTKDNKHQLQKKASAADSVPARATDKHRGAKVRIINNLPALPPETHTVARKIGGKFVQVPFKPSPTTTAAGSSNAATSSKGDRVKGLKFNKTVPSTAEMTKVDSSAPTLGASAGPEVSPMADSAWGAGLGGWGEPPVAAASGSWGDTNAPAVSTGWGSGTPFAWGDATTNTVSQPASGELADAMDVVGPPPAEQDHMPFEESTLLNSDASTLGPAEHAPDQSGPPAIPNDTDVDAFLNQMVFDDSDALSRDTWVGDLKLGSDALRVSLSDASQGRASGLPFSLDILGMQTDITFERNYGVHEYVTLIHPAFSAVRQFAFVEEANPEEKRIFENLAAYMEDVNQIALGFIAVSPTRLHRCSLVLFSRHQKGLPFSISGLQGQKSNSLVLAFIPQVHERQLQIAYEPLSSRQQPLSEVTTATDPTSSNPGTEKANGPSAPVAWPPADMRQYPLRFRKTIANLQLKSADIASFCETTYCMFPDEEMSEMDVESRAILEFMTKSLKAKKVPLTDQQARLVLIHAKGMTDLDKLPLFLERRRGIQVSFYTYGWATHLPPERGCELQGIFEFGGMMTFTPRSIVKHPLAVQRLLASMEDDPYWDAYISPATLAMAHVLATMPEYQFSNEVSEWVVSSITSHVWNPILPKRDSVLSPVEDIMSWYLEKMRLADLSPKDLIKECVRSLAKRLAPQLSTADAEQSAMNVSQGGAWGSSPNVWGTAQSAQASVPTEVPLGQNDVSSGWGGGGWGSGPLGNSGLGSLPPSDWGSKDLESGGSGWGDLTPWDSAVADNGPSAAKVDDPEDIDAEGLLKRLKFDQRRELERQVEDEIVADLKALQLHRGLSTRRRFVIVTEADRVDRVGSHAAPQAVEFIPFSDVSLTFAGMAKQLKQELKQE